MSYRTQSLGGISDSSEEKTTDYNRAFLNRTPQSTVTCVYQTHIAGFWRNITVLWSKNLTKHSLTITVTGLENDDVRYGCKIDLKPWHFWNKKGGKSFRVEGNRVDVYWDLRSAKFSGGPEPKSDFYVALVSDQEVVLLLGDYKKKAYKRTKSRRALVEAALFYKKENVFSKKCFSTRAKLDRKSREHYIVVESSFADPKKPEMVIFVDGVVMIHVENLQWKFRGNHTVMVDENPVQVFWDVHDWLFSNNGIGIGRGLFIFKAGETDESDIEAGGVGCGADSDTSTGGSRYYSSRSCLGTPEFCLLLYAWKLEDSIRNF